MSTDVESPPSASTPPEVTRNWQVVLANVLVMLFALLMLPAFVASFWHWDPCSAVTGVLFGVPTLILGVSAWRSMMHDHQRSADVVAAGCFAVAALCCLPALGILIQAHSLASVGLALSFLGLPATAAWCCLVSRKWAAQLRGPPKPYDPVAYYHARTAGWQWNWEAPRLTLREALLAMAALAWVFGAARWHVQAFKPQAAEHVGREDAPIVLPQDAFDVTYHHWGRDGKTVEFSCTEPTFLEWLEGHKTSYGKLEPIQSGAGSAYSIPSNPKAVPPVGRGWRYHATYGRPDSFLTIEYNADTGRCYYSSASR